MHPLRLSLVFTVVALTACGGNVVFVEDGSGGGGSTTDSVTTSVGTTSSVGTGSSCDLLAAQLDDAVRASVSCDPTISSTQCDGTAVLNDTCACPSILANERNPELYQSALAAYDAWVGAGCGPLDCGAACFPASAGFCQPGPDGTGTCGVFLPD